MVNSCCRSLGCASSGRHKTLCDESDNESDNPGSVLHQEGVRLCVMCPCCVVDPGSVLHQEGAGFLLHAVGAVLVGPPAAGRDPQEEGGRRPRRRGGQGPHDQ